MSTIDEYLMDAQKRLATAQELLQRGDWQRGIFELGCASARIFQTVERLDEQISPSRRE